MSNLDTLIHCEDVGKKFCRDLKKSLWYGVKDSARDLLRKESINSLRDGEFWANHDISFELKRGECLGLIGRNGAGKTTLLKMLNGLIKPDRGHIRMRGNVAAMIALGAGFNPVLTARENIFVNGSILGLSKRQITDKLDEIIDFAEIPEFVDAPVRSFSSGMQVRLGFGIAAILIRPDILLLDEVLAVGDMGFKIKCLNRVRELSQTSAVILVSHTMQMIGSFCTRALVMKNGSVDLDSADVPHAIDHYNSLFASSKEHEVSGNGCATLVHAELDNSLTSNHLAEPISQKTSTAISLRIHINDEQRHSLAIGVRAADQQPLMMLSLVDESGQQVFLTRGDHLVQAELPLSDLTGGEYTLHLLVKDESNTVSLRVDHLAQLNVSGRDVAWVKIVRQARTNVVSDSTPTLASETQALP